MSPRTLIPSVPRAVPQAAATLLRWASALLEALAERLSAPAPSEPAASAGTPHLEFYAEAGAPEGALYADGVRIGVLPGVTRL